jgi:hypothetical protein
VSSIYCAGKIGINCWRLDVVTGLQNALRQLRWDRNSPEWPILPEAVVGGFDYVGPFFDPGMYDGHAPHAFWTPLSGDRQRVQMLCRSAIRRADLFFVWLDTLDTHGTLTEIGWAYDDGVPIHVAVLRGFDPEPLHFALGLAETVAYHDTPAEALWLLGHTASPPRVDRHVRREEVGRLGGTLVPAFTRSSPAWEWSSPERRCPVCDSDHACRLSPDRITLLCFFSEGRGGGRKGGKNGKTWWTYKVVAPADRWPRSEDIRPGSYRREP